MVDEYIGNKISEIFHLLPEPIKWLGYAIIGAYLTRIIYLPSVRKFINSFFALFEQDNVESQESK
jgi:hypothetical protein